MLGFWCLTDNDSWGASSLNSVVELTRLMARAGKRFRLPHRDYLDVEKIKKQIQRSNIERSAHIDAVERRKGRSLWLEVESYLHKKLDSLYLAHKSHTGRIILSFYKSRIYDLQVVCYFKAKDLIIQTYYLHKKKFKGSTRRIPKIPM